MKDTIVQFVCFATNLELDEFTVEWDRYNQKLAGQKEEPVLLQKTAKEKNKFNFISKYEWPVSDFNFTVINDRISKYLPEHRVKILQAGGYTALEQIKKHIVDHNSTKLIAFISHQENDIDFYRDLPLYSSLNTFQAYYESCAYGYVLEFFVPEVNAEELLLLLNQRHTAEAGIYKEALVPQI